MKKRDCDERYWGDQINCDYYEAYYDGYYG